MQEVLNTQAPHIEATENGFNAVVGGAGIYFAPIQDGYNYPFIIRKNDSVLGFKLSDPSTTIPVLNGNTISYPDVFAGVSLMYSIFEDKVKEEILISSPDSLHKFSFRLMEENIESSFMEDGSISYKADDMEIWKLEAPYAMDSNGAELDTYLEYNGSSYTIEVVPTKDTVYPIILDPTVTIPQTATIATVSVNKIYESASTFVTFPVAVGNRKLKKVKFSVTNSYRESSGKARNMQWLDSNMEVLGNINFTNNQDIEIIENAAFIKLELVAYRYMSGSSYYSTTTTLKLADISFDNEEIGFVDYKRTGFKYGITNEAVSNAVTRINIPVTSTPVDFAYIYIAPPGTTFTGSSYTKMVSNTSNFFTTNDMSFFDSNGSFLGKVIVSKATTTSKATVSATVPAGAVIALFTGQCRSTGSSSTYMEFDFSNLLTINGWPTNRLLYNFTASGNITASPELLFEESFTEELTYYVSEENPELQSRMSPWQEFTSFDFKEGRNYWICATSPRTTSQYFTSRFALYAGEEEAEKIPVTATVPLARAVGNSVSTISSFLTRPVMATVQEKSTLRRRTKNAVSILAGILKRAVANNYSMDDIGANRAVGQSAGSEAGLARIITSVSEIYANINRKVAANVTQAFSTNRKVELLNEVEEKTLLTEITSETSTIFRVSYYYLRVKANGEDHPVAKEMMFTGENDYGSSYYSIDSVAFADQNKTVFNSINYMEGTFVEVDPRAYYVRIGVATKGYNAYCDTITKIYLEKTRYNLANYLCANYSKTPYFASTEAKNLVSTLDYQLVNGKTMTYSNFFVTEPDRSLRFGKKSYRIRFTGAETAPIYAMTGRIYLFGEKGEELGNMPIAKPTSTEWTTAEIVVPDYCAMVHINYRFSSVSKETSVQIDFTDTFVQPNTRYANGTINFKAPVSGRAIPQVSFQGTAKSDLKYYICYTTAMGDPRGAVWVPLTGHYDFVKGRDYRLYVTSTIDKSTTVQYMDLLALKSVEVEKIKTTATANLVRVPRHFAKEMHTTLRPIAKKAVCKSATKRKTALDYINTFYTRRRACNGSGASVGTLRAVNASQAVILSSRRITVASQTLTFIMNREVANNHIIVLSTIKKTVRREYTTAIAFRAVSRAEVDYLSTNRRISRREGIKHHTARIVSADCSKAAATLRKVAVYSAVSSMAYRPIIRTEASYLRLRRRISREEALELSTKRIASVIFNKESAILRPVAFKSIISSSSDRSIVVSEAVSSNTRRSITAGYRVQIMLTASISVSCIQSNNLTREVVRDSITGANTKRKVIIDASSKAKLLRPSALSCTREMETVRTLHSICVSRSTTSRKIVRTSITSVGAVRLVRASGSEYVAINSVRKVVSNHAIAQEASRSIGASAKLIHGSARRTGADGSAASPLYRKVVVAQVIKRYTHFASVVNHIISIDTLRQVADNTVTRVNSPTKRPVIVTEVRNLPLKRSSRMPGERKLNLQRVIVKQLRLTEPLNRLVFAGQVLSVNLFRPVIKESKAVYPIKRAVKMDGELKLNLQRVITNQLSLREPLKRSVIKTEINKAPLRRRTMGPVFIEHTLKRETAATYSISLNTIRVKGIRHTTGAKAYREVMAGYCGSSALLRQVIKDYTLVMDTVRQITGESFTLTVPVKREIVALIRAYAPLRRRTKNKVLLKYRTLRRISLEIPDAKRYVFNVSVVDKESFNAIIIDKQAITVSIGNIKAFNININ